ncbi:hypothetical protein [Paraburkholderia sp. EB58]|uniref:hypothetical protein n=1 Tax=Paraburkholderia sp. EB58 TaxID=3035125 RepID=UPI003D19AF91
MQFRNDVHDFFIQFIQYDGQRMVAIVVKTAQISLELLRTQASIQHRRTFVDQPAAMVPQYLQILQQIQAQA